MNADLHTVEILNLTPMCVAAWHQYGPEPDPEMRAWNRLLDWALGRRLIAGGGGHRFFGFNNPMDRHPPEPSGYEVWMTVADDFTGDDVVTVKRFDGGLYARMDTPLSEIEQAWGRFMRQLEQTAYIYDDSRQYLEEHRLTDDQIRTAIYKDAAAFVAGVQLTLYLPLKPKS